MYCSYVTKNCTQGTSITNPEKGLVDALVPVNYYSPRPYLHGSAVPTRREHLATLAKLGVTLLISATVEPLKPGRMVNHQPFASTKTEYLDVDQAIFEDAENMRKIHIPLSDGYPPTEKAMRTFLAESKSTVDAGGGVAVHCWLGKGRTATLLAGYLIHHEGMRPSEAIAFVRSLCNGAITLLQEEYLMNSNFPQNPKEDTQPPPIIHTRPTSECYTTTNESTTQTLASMLTRASSLGCLGNPSCGTAVGSGTYRSGRVCFIGT